MQHSCESCENSGLEAGRSIVRSFRWLLRIVWLQLQSKVNFIYRVHLIPERDSMCFKWKHLICTLYTVYIHTLCRHSIYTYAHVKHMCTDNIETNSQNSLIHFEHNEGKLIKCTGKQESFNLYLNNASVGSNLIQSGKVFQQLGPKKKQTLLHQCLIYPSEGLRRFILNRCVREVVWNKAVYD